jgi:hypothetical protein
MFPIVSGAVTPVNSLIVGTLVLSILVAQIGSFSRLWNRRRFAALLLFVLLGIVGTGSSSNIETLPSWLLAGTLSGVILAAGYVFVLRYAFAIIPIAVGTLTILNVFAAGSVRAYPAAFPGAIGGALLVGVIAWIWSRAAVARVPPLE